MFDVNTSAGELVVNSVSLHTACWRVKDVGRLAFPPELRGDYVTIPGVDGQTAVPQRWQSGRYALDFMMLGDVNNLGAPYADRQAGFISNLNILRTYVLTGPDLTGNRTRPATLTFPGEVSARTAYVHVDLRPGLLTTNYWSDMTLEIRIPDGMFE